jgi:hypothetical protein
MKWVQLPKTLETSPTIYGFINDEGLMTVTCVEEHQDFQDWLAEGNTPELYDTGEDN